jgi:hypothetical protein
MPLKCHHCGKDLLEALYREEQYTANIAFALARPRDTKPSEHVEDIYWACKGECDGALDKKSRGRGLSTSWEDISDLAIPLFFLRWVFSIINSVRDNKTEYSDESYEKLKYFIMAMAQRVLRETTEKERERVLELVSLPDWL